MGGKNEFSAKGRKIRKSMGGEQLEKKNEFKIYVTTYEYVYIATRSLARFPRMQYM